jgi:hypothetical protein
MTPPPNEKSPLARLVLFMVCLSIAGGLVAGACYAAVDLPQQKTIAIPHNEDCSATCMENFNQCAGNCRRGGCTDSEGLSCSQVYENCESNC